MLRHCAVALLTVHHQQPVARACKPVADARVRRLPSKPLPPAPPAPSHRAGTARQQRSSGASATRGWGRGREWRERRRGAPSGGRTPGNSSSTSSRQRLWQCQALYSAAPSGETSRRRRAASAPPANAASACSAALFTGPSRSACRASAAPSVTAPARAATPLSPWRHSTHGGSRARSARPGAGAPPREASPQPRAAAMDPGLAQAARHATTAPPPRHCLYAVHNGMPCLCLHASPRSMPPLHAKRSMSNRRRSRAPARGAVLPAARRGRARAGGAASWCGLPSGTRSRNTVSSGKPNARAARSTTSGPFSGLTPTCAHGAGGR